jgi:peptide/nickel transport system ATP-binding protein
VPIPDPKRKNAKSERILLKGDVPSPIAPPSGCRFHTRCWKATEICRTTEPQLLELKPGQRVACHHPENFEDQAPQDTVLLSDAKEAAKLVADEVLAESAETSAAVAAEVAAEVEASGEPAPAQEPAGASGDSDAAEAPSAEETPEPAAEASPEEPAGEGGRDEPVGEADSEEPAPGKPEAADRQESSDK